MKISPISNYFLGVFGGGGVVAIRRTASPNGIARVTRSARFLVGLVFLVFFIGYFSLCSLDGSSTNFFISSAHPFEFTSIPLAKSILLNAFCNSELLAPNNQAMSIPGCLDSTFSTSSERRVAIDRSVANDFGRIFWIEAAKFFGSCIEACDVGVEGKCRDFGFFSGTWYSKTQSLTIWSLPRLSVRHRSETIFCRLVGLMLLTLKTDTQIWMNNA